MAAEWDPGLALVGDAGDPKLVIDLNVEALILAEAVCPSSSHTAADELCLGGDFVAKDPVETHETAKTLDEPRRGRRSCRGAGGEGGEILALGGG